MSLSKSFIDDYRQIVAGLQVEAADEFTKVMDAWHAANPDASVAESREFCIQAMLDVSEKYAGVSSEVAAQMFDAVCDEEGIDATAEVPDELVNRDMVEGSAHYNAGKLIDGDWAYFVASTARHVDNNVQRAAYETVKKSCKDNDVQWARVPSGRETCGYCFMLASRGFVYVSEDTAKAGSHVGCDCVVVPGKQGVTEVEGYDPDALYERWKECEAAAGSSYFRDVIKEAETRDPGWLWAGKKCLTSKEEGAKPLPKEVAVATVLNNLGFNVVFIKEVNKTNVKTADAYLNGVPWEFKIPEGWSAATSDSIAGEHTVRKQFYKAQGKGTAKLVLSNSENKAPAMEMHAAVEKTLWSGDYQIDEVLVVNAETGSLRRIKK